MAVEGGSDGRREDQARGGKGRAREGKEAKGGHGRGRERERERRGDYLAKAPLDRVRATLPVGRFSSPVLILAIGELAFSGRGDRHIEQQSV